MIAREDLHHLVDRLPEGELPAVRSYLRYVAEVAIDPVLRTLLNAPLDDEPETEAERRAVAEAKEDLAAGRVLTTEEVKRELGL